MINKGKRTWALSVIARLLAKDKSTFDAVQSTSTAEGVERLGKRYGVTSPCTYFIADDFKGVIKIGKSNTPHARLKTLQTANVSTLTLELLIPTDVEMGGLSERDLHSRFGQYRLGGEWFQYSPEIKSFVQKLVAAL
jgi:hypothetical protein